MDLPTIGHVRIDERGQIFWVPADPSKPEQCLADADSLCGAGLFRTDPDDIFRDCCSWHDRAYQNRKFWEEMGFDREWIDRYFLQLMLFVAGSDKLLVARAHAFYAIVRLVGGIFYYRHPAGGIRIHPKPLEG